MPASEFRFHKIDIIALAIIFAIAIALRLLPHAFSPEGQFKPGENAAFECLQAELWDAR